MILTKLVHSCVLVQEGDESILFDPGSFSWNSGLVKIDELPLLNAVVATHQHPDHLNEDFVRALVARWPDLQFVTPPDATELLKTWGVKNVTSESVAELNVTVGNHAPVVPFSNQVQNLFVHWKDKVTMPGDSHDISETKIVLLLPIQAPWGTIIRAMELIQELKPKFVLPIHDWMWNDQWREICYDRTQQICDEVGSTFLRPVDGETLEIEV